MKSKSLLSFTLILLLLVILVLNVTVSSFIYETTDDITEEDLEDMLSTIYNDISTYVEIEHMYGRYNKTDQGRMITQLAILINPYFSTTISLEEIILETITPQDVQLFYFSNHSSKIASNTLFSHPEWNNTSTTHFSIISIFDRDASIEQYNLLNDHSDRVYILIQLPENLWINNNEHIEINILFSSGNKRSLSLQVPFSTKDIVQFY